MSMNLKKNFPVAWMAAFLLFGASAMASEIWDATVIAQPGELQSLRGEWEYLQWDDLGEIPDFSGAVRLRVPGHDAPGAYRTFFTATPRPGETRWILHFGAVGYRCKVYLNGTFIGGHLGGFTPFEFDVTEALQDGENELVVLVQGRAGTLLNPELDDEVSSEVGFTETGIPIAGKGGRSIIGYGYFSFEGIRHEVHLREVPVVRITDATLRPSFREKKLDATVWLANQSEQEQDVVLKLEILPYDIPAKEIGERPVWSMTESLRLGEGFTPVELEHPWEDPQLWMPGDPHLYVARLSLLDGRGREVLNTRDVRFGFREVWVDGPRLYVNGVPFRGFVHGTLGTQISENRARELFQELLDYNLNMVRPSTMPPPPHFARVADEMGMILVGEGELTFNRNHAYEQPAFWDNFQRVWRERVARDKNHPSIFIWSLANEVMLSSPGIPGLGNKFYEGFLALKEADPTRPVMQEGDGDLRDHTPEGTGFPIDIINMHFYDVSPTKNPLWGTEFPPVAWVLEEITEVHEIPGTIKYGVGFPDRDRPWFVGEFGPGVLISYPDHFAFWAGPDAYRDLFGGADGVVRGTGETMALQILGFRDTGMVAMDPWGITPLPWLEPYLKPAMSPVLLFSRDMKSNWFSGETAERGHTVLNDSLQKQSLRLTARLVRNGGTVEELTEAIELEPGARHDGVWEFKLPEVTEAGEIMLEAFVESEDAGRLSEFNQTWRIHPKIGPDRAWGSGAAKLFGDAGALANIADWAGARVHPVSQLSQLRAASTPLAVIDFQSFHALSDSVKRNLEAYVAEGGVLMVLEADLLDFAGLELSANFESDSTKLFLQGSHPLTADTEEADWWFWKPDHYVSRGNFNVPFLARVEVPIIASGNGGMRFSPLITAKHGKGAIIATRLQLNEAIQKEGAAARLLNNAANYASTLEADRAHGPARRVAFLSAEPLNDFWRQRFAEAGIPELEEDVRKAFEDPANHVLFLSGTHQPDAAELRSIERFVREGGTLWVHRINPSTPFLEPLQNWTPGGLTLRDNDLWLQQFEVADSDHPLLNGITDYHTCWATFAWTHGDRYSLRTTPIAEHALLAPDDQVEKLLIQPEWTGQWDSGPGGATLAQEILFNVGKHSRNDNPGAGLIRFPLGDGQVIVDQVAWDDVMFGDAVAIPDKARHYAFSLWRNLKKP